MHFLRLRELLLALQLALIFLYHRQRIFTFLFELMMKTNTDPFIYRPREQLIAYNAKLSDKLSGYTLAVKDLFHIAGIPTTAGNPDWLKSHPIPDCTSPVVATLVSHGATFVGKTITDELAYSLNGQNMHYGTPVNVKASNRLPGGSSSGSATAVANKQADIGLGTDTGGSIRVPASYNGLFGLRPTHSLISTEHMVALAPRFDTVGWMTRDLKTLNAVAEVLLPSPSKGLNGNIYTLPTLIDRVSHAVQLKSFIKDCGFVGFSEAAIDEAILSEASEAFRVLQGREIWRQHGEWLTEHTPHIAPDILQRLQWCETLTSQQEDAAQNKAEKIQQRTAALLSDGASILLPTTPGPAPLLNSSAEDLLHYRNYLLGLTAIAGLCGLPQLHIPLQSEHGAPVGFSLIGPANSDLALIELAATLTGEQA